MRLSQCIFLLPALLLGLVTTINAAAEEPTFIYETTVTGYYLASGHGMASDPEGNAYFIGKTYEDHVHLDIVVIKLDPEGTPLWTRYIIGSGHDWASDITLDSDNDVYITGWTDSEDFPIVNGLDQTLTGFREAFVMKLSTQDGSIQFSTFLGGDYTDEGHGIALNEAGEIYITGSTGSTDFPTTADAYQSGPSAPLYIYTDAFITKFSATGDSILYSTYFGGFEDDQAVALALDDNGEIVIAGHTGASDFPLVNPIQSVPEDLFVSRLSSDGSTLQFSTFLGGADFDRLRGMAVDGNDFVYLTGSTRSVDFPITPGAFQETFAGAINGCGSPPYDPLRNCEDAFLTKLATDGTGIVYSTYLGGSSVDEGSDIVVDGAGRAHIVGNTVSSDFPGSGETTASIFVSKLSEDGGDLLYTFTKPSYSANAGHGITFGDAGQVYFTGAINAPADFYVGKIGDGNEIVTSVEEADVIGPAARLDDPRPNPFNPTTTIHFTLEDASHARLVVYDPAGRRVVTLADGNLGAGEIQRVWDGKDANRRDVSSGVYFARLQAGDFTATRKMVLLR